MITISNLAMQFGGSVLFKQVDLQFTPGSCYGIIGANGAGKSTFLKLLSGELEPTSGEIFIKPGARMSVLKQDQNQYDAYTILDTVIMGNQHLYDVMKEKDALYEKPDFSEEDGMRASELEAEFADMDGWEAESDASRILQGLGVSPDIADCWNPNGTPQQAIDSIRACGGRAVLAHPAWSLNTTELMCSFRGLSGVEIFNSVSSVPTNALRGDSAAMLDPVFANGQLLNCFANDDSHRYEGECGMSATMLNTNDRSVAGILRAIDEGRFYATQGPEIRELSLTDGVVHIACSPAKYIIFYSNEVWIPNRTRALEGQTSADYVVSPRESFVRVQVVAEDGKSAWTSPIKLG